MWLRNREILKNDDVVLILKRRLPASLDGTWSPSLVYAICLPKQRLFFGYRVIGQCDLRLGYSENLYYGGHIGYRINEPFRGHRRAYHAVKLLLERARREQLPYVMITCNPDNLPSRKTLEHFVQEGQSEMLQIVDLPPHNEMYQDGERQKCLFFFPLDPGAKAPEGPLDHPIYPPADTPPDRPASH